MASQRKLDEWEEKYRFIFNKYDKNQNGTIDVKELGIMMRQFGNPSEQEIKDKMAKFDVDGSGEIAFQEFCQMMDERCVEGEGEDQLRKAFESFDKDNNGHLTVKELKDIMISFGEKLSKKELEQMFKDVDKNGDKKIDYCEFAKCMCE